MTRRRRTDGAARAARPRREHRSPMAAHHCPFKNLRARSTVRRRVRGGVGRDHACLARSRLDTRVANRFASGLGVAATGLLRLLMARRRLHKSGRVACRKRLGKGLVNFPFALPNATAAFVLLARRRATVLSHDAAFRWLKATATKDAPKVIRLTARNTPGTKRPACGSAQTSSAPRTALKPQTPFAPTGRSCCGDGRWRAPRRRRLGPLCSRRVQG